MSRWASRERDITAAFFLEVTSQYPAGNLNLQPEQGFVFYGL